MGFTLILEDSVAGINTAVVLFNFSPLGYFRHHTGLRKPKELLYDNPKQKLLVVIWQY